MDSDDDYPFYAPRKELSLKHVLALINDTEGDKNSSGQSKQPGVRSETCENSGVAMMEMDFKLGRRARPSA
jgi:hypothetical protein